MNWPGGPSLPVPLQSHMLCSPAQRRREAAAGLLHAGASKVALLVAVVALRGAVHILDCGQQPALEDNVVVDAAVCGGGISETYD